MSLLSPFRLHAGSRSPRGPVVSRLLYVAKNVRSSLPFPPENAKYHRELEAAIDAVQRACRLCVDVKKSLALGKGRILEKKKDQTPVTVADFGVQALISLELSRSFPSIGLVAEEDSSFLRDQNGLVSSVLKAVAAETSINNESLTADVILDAIDRGGKHAFPLEEKPENYWVLDPIDGTRGFLKGNDALYVVGLALVVDGEVALGIMGCPNWKNDHAKTDDDDDGDERSKPSSQGMIMIAHVGRGTWVRQLPASTDSVADSLDGWKKCYVDPCSTMNHAVFLIPESQKWESLPLSGSHGVTYDASKSKNEDKITLMKVCCGSLCKYLMVASGRASAFIQRSRSRTTIKAWDHVAGVVCVHEAGGKVSDWKGSWLDLTADLSQRRVLSPSGGILVTNGHLHSQLISLLSPSPSSAV